MNDNDGTKMVLDGMIRTLIERVNVNLNQSYEPKKQRVFPSCKTMLIASKE